MALTDDSSPQTIQTWHTWWIWMCVRCAFIVVGLKKFILDPLTTKAIEMSHMDPTDIIAVPYPVSKLAVFVGFTVLLVGLPEFVFIQTRKQISNRIMLALLVYVSFVLVGAHPTREFCSTLLSALYTSILAWTEPSQQFPFTAFSESGAIHEFPTTKRDAVAISRLICTFLVAIPFQVLQILDHGDQVQRWPLPIILGVTAGHVVGILGGILYASLFVHEKKS